MADYNVKGFDDDGTDHSNDFTSTDEGWFRPSYFTGATFPFYLKHYNFDESQEIGATGTGLFNPFLNMNGGSTLLGFNTNEDIKKPYTDAGLTISDPNTDAIQLGDIPIVYKDLDGNGSLEGYYVINLDINENVNKDVSLEELQLFTSANPAVLSQYHSGGGTAFLPADGFTLRFDLDANTNNKLLLEDDGAGQGKLDYTFYFPVSMFSGSSPTDYLTLFSQFGPEPPDDAGFAEWNVLTAAKIEGTKFNDVNGDGTRDVNGIDNILGNGDDEVPLAGFTMYIDLNGNNKLDVGEQTALTDANGHFTFYSLLPNTSYTVREVLTAADVGVGLNFSDYDPPAGAWEQTTDPLNDGDQIVNVTTGTATMLVGNHVKVPNFTIDKSIVSVVGGVELQGGDPNTTADNAVNSAGDQINYRITIVNTGELALALTSISDALEGVGVTVNADSFTESGTNNNILDIGETWTWNWTETVSQTELDALCADDETITNTVTATFNYNGTDIGPKSDTVNTSVVCSPDFTAVKSIVSVEGGVELLGGDPSTTADDAVNSAGDKINYRLTIVNTGNVTLDGETITDTFEGAASGLTAADFTETGGNAALNGNGQLDVGETWTYNFTETVTQTELDALCADDETITNTLAASFVFDGETLGPKGNTVNTSVVCSPDFTAVKSIVSVEGGVELLGGDPSTTADDAVNSAGDKINYRLTIVNTGNVTLDGETITDTLEGTGSGLTAADFTETGGNAALNGNGQLDVGETWTYNFTETVTQTELDALCADDETITNTLAASFVFDGETLGPKGNTVNTSVVCSPDFTAVKSIVSVEGGVELLGGDPLTTADDAVDSVGDKINYRITIVNTGNVTLDGETITDTLEGTGSGLTAADFTETGGTGTNGDGILDVGETWTYNFTETVTQDVIDEACADDEKITNTLAASFVFDGETVGPKGNSVDTAVVCAPSVELIKYVDVGFGWDDANTGPGPNNVNVGGDVNFKITVENTGPVTLTDVDITDTYHSGGASGPANLLVDDGVLTAYAIAHNAVLTGDDNDGDAGNGLVADGILQVGETWTITYTEAFDPLSVSPGSHLNTADVNTAEGATDEDSAYYFSLVDTGLCPRTPGFWQNMKNGGQFWDQQGGEKHAGQDGFPDGDLLYKVDSDGNGVVNSSDSNVWGLLIGDYNKNGIADNLGLDGIAGTGDDFQEDVLYVSYADARQLINASNKQLNGQSGDGKFMLGRDMVASWLNYLQGSGFGDPADASDTHSPAHYLNDAIDWMQIYSGTNSGGTTETWDKFKLSTAVIKTSDPKWNTIQSGFDHSASQMHSALDYYNNTGQTEPGGTHYANCCTNEFITALGIYETAHG
ncbi:DUF11 domain-containing protein [Sphingomonas hankyongi]|uniref:DUF11 domain-containing protein n=1 Tax=Sphingomonas hankyongi TaxID=2908209 RepID=A0ABT0S1Z4_9SPHN|nr:DUF11 domain-containing protein [Sphingomonas hankyongi]MCL6729679.1 DUF11 domain-containing protein [Sphingomonas hankyongi]